MSYLQQLSDEARPCPYAPKYAPDKYVADGFRQHFSEPVPIARAYSSAAIFTQHRKHVYPHDLIAGSTRGLYILDDQITDAELSYSRDILQSYGIMNFSHNFDHYAADYETFLAEGIQGTLEKIHRSMEKHQFDSDAEKKLTFLKAAEIAMTGFQTMVGQYAETFHEALQLVWLVHLAFLLEGRVAMAFGRMDQYLYPYYKKDREAGRLTAEQARTLLECTFIKIVELGRYDICNIAIGGVLRDGSGGINELSYLILEAVGNCNVPGPNLSARYYEGAPDEFLDACLKVIGTGLGYPALMNDEVNIPALHRQGYSLEDSRNYCMVGCIENFIQGKQPPWTDGRYNSPKYLELALNDGKCMQTGIQMGPHTGDPENFHTMDQFMEALHIQMEAGTAEYMARFRNENDRYNRVNYTQPFLSCFCQDCINRGLDINDGGAFYPSVHGAGCMGIATMADSLAAVERVIYQEKLATMSELRQALLNNYEGYDSLRQALLSAPKYGNNDDFVDKYAVWFVKKHEELFEKYQTRDGGAIYIGIASNVNNIPAGQLVAATPDGRRNGEPVSEAASPMHGMDKRGPTSVVLSTTKPDFSMASCGTVLNQKYSPSMFTNPEKRAKLLQLIKVYFQGGGQEMQINAVSREILQDAMEHPENHSSLVVRVSGFSAFYTILDKSVQEDILERTEHG